jgi:DNA-binding LytR/AlgR family response regulator
LKKIFIVEDDEEFAENVGTIMDLFGYSVVGKEGSGEKSVDLIFDLRPDVILLDLMLSGDLNGIDVALKVREFTQVPIVFMTGHSDKCHLENIALLEGIYFIHKPFSKEMLNSIIYLAILKYKVGVKLTSILNIKDKGFTVPLKIDEILMLKADGLYTRIYTGEKQYVVRAILKDISATLSINSFIRIHKSYIVNIDYVTSFNSKYVTLLNHVAPIRRGYVKELRKLFNNRFKN